MNIRKIFRTPKPIGRFFLGLTLVGFILSNMASVPAVASAEQQAPLTFARGVSGNFLAGKLAAQDNDTQAAAKYFVRALNRDPGNTFLIQQAFFLHLMNGDIEQSRPYAEEILSLDAGHDLARTVLGSMALKEGNYAIAVDEFSAATQAQPLEQLTNQLLAAWSEAGRDNFEGALLRVDALEGPDWYESFRAFHSGLIASFLDEAVTAEERINQAYAIDPSALRTVEAFARIRAQNGKQEEALAAIDEFMQRLPRHPYISAVRADIQDGRSRRLNRSAASGAAEVMFGLGTALGREGGTDLPKIYLQLALYLNPRSDIAAMALADIYQDDEQYRLAIDLIDTLSEKSPFYEGAIIESALNLAQLEEIDEAIRRLNEVARTMDDPTSANLTLGNLLRFEERFEEANDIYSIIIDEIETVEPRHWSLLYSRGITYERTDRWAEAEADFRQALDLNDDHPLVLNYLGYSLIDKDMKLDEALGMIERAVEQRPEEGFIIDSLGWAYYKLGRYEEAVVELERAATLMADDPLIHDHLGDAYWRTGRELEAKFKWRHALALDPEPEQIELIGTKLENGMPSIENETQAEEEIEVAAGPVHVVDEGESLWDIAEQYLEDGAAFPRILEINRDRLPEDGRLEPGVELRIPR